MIANPDLLRLADAPLAAIIAVIRVGLGLILISNAIIGKAHPALRLIMGAAGLVIVFFGIWI